MGGWRALTVGVVLAAVLSSCGGGDDTASTTVTNPATNGVRSRVLTSKELAGFRVVGESVQTAPDSWVSVEQLPADQAAAETAVLKRDGFRAGVHEDLMSGDGRSAASVVEQFRSPEAAADALGFHLKQFKANPASAGAYHAFEVTGIPDAVGFSLGATAGGINIVFSDGAFYYLVGKEGGGTAAIAKLNAAARQLYHRVHG